MNRRVCLAAAAATTALLLAGCATTRDFNVPQGFPTLTVVPGDGDTLVFSREGLDLSAYRRVFIEPVQVRIRNAGGESSVNDAEAKEIAAHLSKRLAESLGKDFELVGAPGADVLRMRFTITDLQPTNAAQAAMLLPPFSMVNMVSPKGAFTGSLTLAGEFFEGRAAQPSVAFLAYRSRPGIDATAAFGRWTAVRTVIDKAAERIAGDLVALRKKG